ncbi:ABC transporter substrate-binding protein [Rivibacter subsaxonicus]|uniref:Dipeptide transport system substrate-binding protein n=1 Tax=Rivibacter subsaxonicus TaxID=457575 RepID=A0A4Q7VE94_9BURK|nr:ABC transporter substrate-binding protein [Rivibacter subsaxonicus]RZT93883.1 dipeptide transport system substrate-binding protein [Rivibacter subsaxonicus]
MRIDLRSRLALLAALLLAAPAHAAGTLTVCAEGAPEGFDIVQYELANTNDIAGLPIYDQLLRFKPGTTELMPGIAERWDISADGLVYDLHLRRGVRFHSTPWFKPSRELNADDVLFSINRMFDKSHPAHGSARNGYVYWAGMQMSALIRSVEKLDPYKVRFTLTRPNAPFLANLAIANIGSVYPAEYAGQLLKANRLDQLNTQPVGSGPFVFRSYQKDAIVRYDANLDYWAGRPPVDRLVFAVTIDPDVRAQRLLAGECLVGDLKSQSVASLKPGGVLEVLRFNPLVTSYLALNTQHKLLDDARLRRALWLAIDKKAYIQAVNAGFATPAASFLPPGIWSHDPTLKDRADPQEARELVKAAGYDGSELQLFIGTGSDRKRAAEMLQADWAKVGIKVQVRVMELGELYKRTGAGEHDIALLSWFGDNGDPDNFFSPNLSCVAAAKGGGNKAHWCDKSFDALLDAANRSTDRARRSELYRQAQRKVHEEVPVIPLTYPVELTGLNKRVGGFVPSPFANMDFRAVSLKP